MSEELYEKFKKERLSGTCGWLLDRRAFTDWESSDFLDEKPKVLWIHGPGGYGKTILSASVLEYLASKNSPVAGFFMSSDFDESCRDPFMAVRSWVAQVIASNLEAADIAYEKWDEQLGEVATRGMLLQLFHSLLSKISGYTFVLDGLDECLWVRDGRPSNDSDSIASFFSELASAIKKTRNRILLVSRDENPIREGVALCDGVQVSEYTLTPQDVKHDAAKYARHIIERRLHSKSETTKDDLSKAMAEHCDSMFLWIKLQEAELRSWKNETQLHAAITKSPPKLNSLYERNWARMMALSHDRKSRAFLLLRWVAFAWKPLCVSEVCEAVLIAENDTEFDMDELPDDITEDYIQSEITNLCGSLVELRDQASTDPSSGPSLLEDKLVCLAHFSVRQFFIDHIEDTAGTLAVERRSRYLIEQAQHTELAILCLRYNAFCCNAVSSELKHLARPSRVFWDYAAGRWPDHALAGEESQAELFGLITSLFDNSTSEWAVWSGQMERILDLKIANMVNSTIRNDKDSRSSTAPLFWAARFGLLQAVRYLLRVKKVDVNEHASLGRPALPNACRVDNVEIIRELLQAGADTGVVFINTWRPIDSLPGNLASPETFSPKILTQEASIDVSEEFEGLYLASCRSGDKFLVDASQKHMALGDTPLHTAIAFGQLETTKLLLQHGASPYFTGSPVSASALDFAASIGNVSMAKLLLEHRTDASVPELAYGFTALFWAVKAKAVDVARLLLTQHNTDPNARDGAGRTPLFYAFGNTDYQMVQVLLESGADPNALWKYDNVYHSPLRTAVITGSIPIVKLLLLHGADPNAVHRDGTTVLHLAADIMDPEIFELILEKSDSSMMTDSKEWTPLHHAVLAAQPKIVNLLLGLGADPNVGDMHGDTPLHISIVSQLMDVEKLNVILNLTPTFVAPTDSQRAEVVDLLLDNGANMDAQDNDGRTPLQYAMLCSNCLPSKRLFERNAGRLRCAMVRRRYIHGGTVSGTKTARTKGRTFRMKKRFLGNLHFHNTPTAGGT